MDKLLKNKKTIAIFMLPATILYICVVLIPIIWSGVYSFYDGIPGLNFEFVGLQNYLKLANDKIFITSVIVNLKYVVVVVTGQVSLGLLAALLFNFSIKKYKNLARTIVFFPNILPTVAVAALFVKIFEISPQYGLVNSVLHSLNLDSLIQPWLGQPATAFAVLCGSDIWKAIGFYALIFYAALMDVPEDTIEAARIDGARGIRLLWNIILPQIKPILIIGLIFSLNGCLKVFDSPVALTNGGPGTATSMVSMYMFSTSFNYGQYGYGSSIAIFVLIECLLITMVVNYISSRNKLD